MPIAAAVSRCTLWQIRRQIAQMQGATKESVGAIQEIAASIVSVNQSATTIAAAVEEQGAATKEIARNVQEAAQGTQEVSTNIVGVNKSASETGDMAHSLLSAAEELTQQSGRLGKACEDFFARIRAA